MERGIGASVFRNGLFEIKRFASHPDTRYDFGDLPLEDILPYRLAAEPIMPDVVRARVRDPAWAVFIFQRPPHLVRQVTSANVEQVLGGADPS